MSKFLKIMIVLLTIAAFAAPAFATDITISGQFRAEYYNLDNYDYNDSVDDNVDVFDQRFRLDTNYMAAEGVKVRFRADFGESEWGNGGQSAVRNEDVVQIDYAYLQIDKDIFSLTAGQHYFGLGNAIAVDTIGTGVSVATKTPVYVKAAFFKFNEGDTTMDDIKADEDENFYAAAIGHKGDNYNAELFYAMVDNGATDDNKNVIGLAVDFNMDAVKLKAELNLLDGDNGTGTDYSGTQFYLDASTAVSETVAVGGFFLYAQAPDAGDTQIQSVTNWDSFMPETYGYISATKIVMADPINDPINDGWDNSFGAQFGNGIISGAVYGTFKVSDDLGIKALAQYMVEEDDSARDYDALNFNLSAKYTGFAPNTSIVGQINYFAPGDDLDNALGLLTQLQVAF